MFTITLHPGLFSRPSSPHTAASIRSYVSTLLHWKEVLDQRAVSILTSEQTNALLMKCGVYPFRPWLKTILADTAVIEFDFNTIAVLVETLISRSNVLEEVTHIQDVLVRDLYVVPDIIKSEPPGDLQAAAERCAAILAICGAIRSPKSAPRHAMAVKATAFSGVVLVKAKIEILECNVDEPKLPMFPEEFSGGIISCSNFEAFLQSLDVTRFFTTSLTHEETDILIRVALFQSRVARGLKIGWRGIPQFKMHKNFCSSALSCGAFSSNPLAGSLLRSIVDTIDNLNLADTHILRTTAAPNAPALTRDNAIAMRRDITHEHHLHYWQPDDGGPKELACVVAHNCFDMNSR